MIISRTPFRISFFGGGTDFPEFYREHGGACLLSAIDKHSYILVHRLPAFFRYPYHASYAKTELVNEPDEFQHPLIRESLKLLGVNSGLEMMHVSDLPGRTGLGTSSAFTVGLLHALHKLGGDDVNAEDLAREAIVVERERVGDAGGHQDQYAAAYGGMLRLDFPRSDQPRITRLALTSERVRALEASLMLFYTGMQQSAHHIQQQQRDRVRQNVDVLREMATLVDEAQHVLLSDQPLTAIGDLLHASWMKKRSLVDGISTTEVDAAYDVAREAGARGGELWCAGGRGFLLIYADPDRQPAVRERLHALREVAFRFSPDGSRIIFQTEHELTEPLGDELRSVAARGAPNR